jgi:hypothetical protein
MNTFFIALFSLGIAYFIGVGIWIVYIKIQENIQDKHTDFLIHHFYGNKKCFNIKIGTLFSFL